MHLFNYRSYIFISEMTESAAQKAVSKMILTQFGDITGSSKLHLIENLYQSQELGVSDEISLSVRDLSKKIFGSGLSGFTTHSCFNCPIPAHLTAFAQILLLISFQDEHVMSILIEEVKNSAKFLSQLTNFPFLGAGISALQLKSITSEMLLKMNGWRKIFTIADIMKNYHISAEVFGIFLRELLIKVGYNGAQNCQNQLEKTHDLYAMLFEYFDLNVVTKTKSISKTHQTSDLYMFPDYNLFIATCDKKQYCTGRYYDNEEELLKSERTVRKSTLEYIIQSKKTTAKRGFGEEELQSQKDSEQQQYQCKVTSTQQSKQFDINSSDASNYFAQSTETPYFSCDQQTPEFGNQSLRFQKSIDFEGAAENARFTEQNGFTKKQHQLKSSDNKNFHLLGDSLKQSQKEYFMNFKLDSLTINEEEQERDNQVSKKAEIPFAQIQKEQKFLFETFQDLSKKQKMKTEQSSKSKNTLFIPRGASLHDVKNCESQRPSSEEKEDPKQQIQKQKRKEAEKPRSPFTQMHCDRNDQFLCPPSGGDITEPVSPSADQSSHYLYPMKSSRSNRNFQSIKTEVIKRPKYAFQQTGDQSTANPAHKSLSQTSTKKKDIRSRNFVESPKKLKNDRKYSTNYKPQTQEFSKFQNIHSSSYLQQKQYEVLSQKNTYTKQKFDIQSKSDKNIFSEYGKKRKALKMGLTSNTVNFMVDVKDRLQGNGENMLKVEKEFDLNMGKRDYRQSHKIENQKTYQKNNLMMTKSMERVDGWEKTYDFSSKIVHKKDEPSNHYNLLSSFEGKTGNPSKKGKFPQFLRNKNKQKTTQHHFVKPMSPIISSHRKKKSFISNTENSNHKQKFLSPGIKLPNSSKNINVSQQIRFPEQKSQRNNYIPMKINSINTKSQPELKTEGAIVFHPQSHQDLQKYNFRPQANSYGFPFFSKPTTPKTFTKIVHQPINWNKYGQNLTESEELQRLNNYSRQPPKIGSLMDSVSPPGSYRSIPFSQRRRC